MGISVVASQVRVGVTTDHVLETGTVPYMERRDVVAGGVAYPIPPNAVELSAEQPSSVQLEKQKMAFAVRDKSSKCDCGLPCLV